VSTEPTDRSERIYLCTPARHAFHERHVRVESSARFLQDVGDDEPMDCCTLTRIAERVADTSASVPIEDCIATLPDSDDDR
jgi:hypothetical protein